ncbi:hypothetical protein ADL00_02035 [Streptomyces sp. AS58]|nr:hypothetical protein ADL00_02035 [Streptomyces sp. AS58]
MLLGIPETSNFPLAASPRLSAASKAERPAARVVARRHRTDSLCPSPGVSAGATAGPRRCRTSHR